MAEMAVEVTSESALQPPLSRDATFHGMTATQFLGAFNDNLFKQMVLLLCATYAAKQGGGDIYQSTAQFLFALPFILFSGFAGYLSERYKKKTVIVLAKAAEAVVMLLGVVAFFFWATGTLSLLAALFVVLFLMGTQSAFFGPSKYGVLPELFRGRDLPIVNGVIQMTTFLAIIFGTAIAGYAMETFSNHLWVVSGICVGIGVIGTLTALVLRDPPASDPTLKPDYSAVFISKKTWAMIRNDAALLRTVFVSSLFWMIGGVVLPVVNYYGEKQLKLDLTKIGFLSAGMGTGIAIGCALAGKLSRNQVNFHMVRLSAWGLTGIFCVLTGLGISGLSQDWMFGLSLTALIVLGIFAGFFVVPLEVFMQVRPPEGQKGRMIAAKNLLNWIGILISAGVYLVCSIVLNKMQLPISWSFLLLAALMLPVALFFHPADEDLSS